VSITEEVCFDALNVTTTRPSSANTHAHLGRTLMRMGRITEGLKHVHYAMRLSPREPMPAYWLEWVGSAELELGHFPQAIDYFARSRALNPDYSWSLASCDHWHPT
jgi:hypothetical protein